ncbi:(2Fe-2S)-binding protein [Bradyrhizobium niftali]|jgi:predicted molibdopterin-dependent oxidoreductase YjgC|uniref:(2Fe-2S)-binding protein n=1 Tax=Bradyrhizobium niftali TaxID=2560055 RepID=A0A4Y9M248_9BRAD|nr:(2Fe-2S)-binding protein [Bradyrhizobium niftali]TFV49249.1 (2Fe-2S)-binding protein [Bradyrhizobium niftali]
MRLQRLAETDRAAVSFVLDGTPVAALEGDSLLTAILAHDGYLRVSEFGDGLRAGFCLMGACQDCWVNVEGGGRVRACTTPLTGGMRVSRRIVQP